LFVVAGEWWELDLDELDRRMVDGDFDDNPSGATMNGKLGDLYSCSGNH
jgi:laccase